MFSLFQNVMSIYFIAETSLLLLAQEPLHFMKGCYVATHQLSSELNTAQERGISDDLERS